MLKPYIKEIEPHQAKEIESLFEGFPDYQWSEIPERKLLAKLYKHLLSQVGKEKMIEVADALLRLQRI